MKELSRGFLSHFEGEEFHPIEYSDYNLLNINTMWVIIIIFQWEVSYSWCIKRVIFRFYDYCFIVKNYYLEHTSRGCKDSALV